ncbi:MAG: hypothetical protein IJB82_03870, partial [Bacilli bacterium]|nr:hypothetical protein [Bacilli bacterium]
NVEAYTSYDKTRKNKNINYLSKLCLNYYNNKNNYDNKIKIIQINLIKRKYRDVHYIQGKKIYTDIISIIEVGIDNKDDLKYTKSEHNLKLWCNLLNTKVEEIDKVFKIIEEMKYEKEEKEKMRKEVYDKMSDINLLQTTWDDLKKLEILDAEKAGKKAGLAEGKKAGLAEGKKLVKNTIFKHIMKMLKMNMKYSDISEITGVSIEKIKEYTHEIDINRNN